jgi:hypothetical protein
MIIIRQVFGLLRQGDGRIIITASSEDKMLTVRLPVLETEDSAWEFFEILFEELRCEPFYDREPARCPFWESPFPAETFWGKIFAAEL